MDCLAGSKNCALNSTVSCPNVSHSAQSIETCIVCTPHAEPGFSSSNVEHAPQSADLGRCNKDSSTNGLGAKVF